MKFTAQEEYGLRCVLQVARRQPNQGSTPPGARSRPAALSIAEVARFEGLTPQYAGKLLSILVKAGILESERGRNGGVRLSRPAEAISVADVLEALGGALYEPDLCDRYKGDRSYCVHSSDCSIRTLWAGLQLMINRVLSRTSLRDLCGDEKSMEHWMHAQEESMENFLPVSELVSFAGARERGRAPGSCCGDGTTSGSPRDEAKVTAR